MTKKIDTLADLTPDGENFNKHTEFGAGRSILVDKGGNIIAGNSTTETAAAIGMEDVIVVPTDGKKLVVVQRTDLKLDSKEGRELALADNMTALKGIEIDLDKVKETLGEDLAKAWGMDFQETKKSVMKEKELRPFVMNHVLISYPLDMHDVVMEAVSSLIGKNGIEIEQAANG
jgi:hypothetical protein